jgi:hypothetical protein
VAGLVVSDEVCVPGSRYVRLMLYMSGSSSNVRLVYREFVKEVYAIAHVPLHGDLEVGTAFSMLTATPRASLFRGAYVTRRRNVEGRSWRQRRPRTNEQVRLSSDSLH